MGFYSQFILPHVIDLAMRNRELAPHRQRVLSQARGRVLEIGSGSGRNFPLYAAPVESVIALELSAQLIAMARPAAERAAVPIALLEGSANAIPADRGSFDAVVSTWTLCSIADVEGALCEMRRVLKPGGQFLFVEHGLSPEAKVQRWQRRLTPVWKRIGGGCHLDRPIADLVSAAGFAVADLESGYIQGPKPLTYLYHGQALP